MAAAKVPQLRGRLHDQALSAETPGLMAFAGDRAVGWVSLGPRTGFEALEAYPVAVEDGGTIHPDAAFTGTLPMFERAGFTVVADRASDPSSGNRRVVVRREL